MIKIGAVYALGFACICSSQNSLCTAKILVLSVFKIQTALVGNIFLDSISTREAYAHDRMDWCCRWPHCDIVIGLQSASARSFTAYKQDMQERGFSAVSLLMMPDAIIISMANLYPMVRSWHMGLKQA
eukprot:6202251-Pleurochrysis_carterae.AAC.3